MKPFEGDWLRALSLSLIFPSTTVIQSKHQISTIYRRCEYVHSVLICLLNTKNLILMCVSVPDHPWIYMWKMCAMHNLQTSDTKQTISVYIEYLSMVSTSKSYMKLNSIRQTLLSISWVFCACTNEHVEYLNAQIRIASIPNGYSCLCNSFSKRDRKKER